MFAISKKLLVLSLLAASAPLVACAAPYGEGEESGKQEKKDEALPPPPVFSAEGVTLEENQPDHAKGRFERHDAQIRFTIDRDRSTDTRHLVITRLSGEVLVDSTLKDHIDSSRYLDGRFTMVGRNDEEPQSSGDKEAFDLLTKSPEWKIIPELKTSLGAAGVAEELMSAPKVEGEGLKPNVYSKYSSTPWPDNQWYPLYSQESLSFYSWGFWATTVVAIVSYTGSRYYSADISVGPYGKTWLSGYGEGRYYFQWAGAYVNVRNPQIPLCSVYWPYTCADVREYVLIK